MAGERAAQGVCLPYEQCTSDDCCVVSLGPFYDCLSVSDGNSDSLISYTWANEVCAGDNEERALVISSMNGMQYAVDAWLPIVIFPQTMAPSFSKSIPNHAKHLCRDISATAGEEVVAALQAVPAFAAYEFPANRRIF